MNPSKYQIRNLIINPESIDSTLLCLICQQFVIDPKECELCQTLFCSICIEQWLKNSQTCPNRCKELKIRNPHRMYKNALEQVLFKCAKQGCQQQMKIDDLENHMKYCQNSLFNDLLESNQNNKDGYKGAYCDKCNTKLITLFSHDCIKSLNGKIKEVETSFQQFQQQSIKITAELLERIAKCEKQQEKIKSPQCEQQHNLKWIYPQNNTVCQSCKLSTTTARYICDQCRTYFCQKCRKPSIKDGFCPVNHPLQFNLQALPQVHCDYCMMNIFSRGESVFSDRFCDLDICNSCYQNLKKGYQ